jgi:hypothetical protein
MYSVQSGGTPVWTETQALTAGQGVVSTMLGAVTPIHDTFSGSRYISVQVGSDAEMAPRTMLAAVPLALTLPGVYPDTGTGNVSLTGNLGLGTNAPAFKLDAHAPQAVARLTSNANANGSVIELRNDTASAGTLGAINFTRFNAGGLEYPGQIAYYKPDALAFRVGGTEQARLTASGRLGIGTSQPGFPLTFGSALGDKVALYTAADGVNSVGFGVQASLLQIHSDTPTSDIAFGYGSSAAFTENVRFTHDGKVGISTQAPERTLDVRYQGDSGRSSLRVQSNGLGGSVLELQTLNPTWGTIYADFLGEIRFLGGSNVVGQITMNPLSVMSISTLGSPRITIAASGRVGIGNVNPTEMLDVAGNVKALNVTVPSDSRLKKDIRPLTAALEKVESWNGVTYNWSPETFPGHHPPTGRQVGLIAQEVERSLPEVVRTDAEGYKSLSYQNLVPVLVEAIKEQQKQIGNKDARIRELENRMTRLERALLKRTRSGR